MIHFGYRNRAPQSVIRGWYRDLRYCFSKVDDRRNEIDISLEIVRNRVLRDSQLLNASILVVIKGDIEKTIRRGDCGREIYIYAVTVYIRDTGTFKPCQDRGTRIWWWRDFVEGVRYSSDAYLQGFS